MSIISSIDELEAIYGAPSEAATVKEVDHVTEEYRAYIEASPFIALATCGPEGLDCSPRGDVNGFVRCADPRTLMIADRRGNNRVDSLRNIVRDPRVAMLFLVPGSKNTLRIFGHARISVEPALLASFEVQGKLPRSVIVIAVQSAYFQCGRAIVRSGLWDVQRQVDPASLPTPGEMLAAVSDNRLGGEGYDADWPERARETLW